jgi:nitrogen regulatory protein PII
MAQTIEVTLITIVTPAEFADRLEEELRKLGARGYTISGVSGQGQSRARWLGWFSTANVRIETLVTRDVATRILDHVAAQADLRMFAFAQSVEAVPVQRFASHLPVARI